MDGVPFVSFQDGRHLQTGCDISFNPILPLSKLRLKVPTVPSSYLKFKIEVKYTRPRILFIVVHFV